MVEEEREAWRTGDAAAVVAARENAANVEGEPAADRLKKEGEAPAPPPRPLRPLRHPLPLRRPRRRRCAQ